VRTNFVEIVIISAVWRFCHKNLASLIELLFDVLIILALIEAFDDISVYSCSCTVAHQCRLYDFLLLRAITEESWLCKLIETRVCVCVCVRVCVMQTKLVQTRWKWCWKMLAWWWESAMRTWAVSSWPALISLHSSSTPTSPLQRPTSRSFYSTAKCPRSVQTLLPSICCGLIAQHAAQQSNAQQSTSWHAKMLHNLLYNLLSKTQQHVMYWRLSAASLP